MSKDFRIILCLAVIAPFIVYGVFHFPPLTTRGAAGSAAVDQTRYKAVYDDELDHCEDQPESYDCKCYARISGVVQAGEEIKVTGAIRADRQELARLQAAGSC